MFEVIDKENGSVYKVYDVIRIDGFILFLIYECGVWEYYMANEFEPYKEIY